MSLASVKILTILQQSGYQVSGVMSWLRLSKFSTLIRYIAYALLTTGVMLLFIFCFQAENAHYYSMLIYLLISVLFIYLMFVPKAKVPLRLTPRMIRLIVINTLLCGGLSVGGYFLSMTPIYEAAYGALPALIIPCVLAAHFIMLPFEKLIARGFIVEAAREIETRKAGGMKVVGITGSYGKTTAKNILAGMLSKKYKTCKGAGSFNTPLGLCRVVNDCLESGDEILIAEMGARRVGDIKELCDIAKPDIGIITAVGSQHLETFGSLENIAKAKYELIENLIGDFAVFNSDDAGAKALYEKCALPEKTVTGMDDGCFVRYENVKYGKYGAAFTLICCGEKAEVETKLLGEYVPSLISACAAVAVRLGVPLSSCADACAALEPVPHRLQLSVNGETYIIDDSYNANTAGALCSLKVLAAFNCLKIIITPGLVELGKDEKAANAEFGAQIAQYADKAILVGSRAGVIKSGAESGGMADENIICVKTLEEASSALAGFAGEKAVLFENDLTDSYS